MTARPVLCVDDEPTNLALLRQVLGDQFRLVFARNGADALAGAKKHQPSLILLDVDMPDMNGFEVCRQLKMDSETRDIPVIFVTAMSEAVDEQTGFDAGGVDYITKPYSPPVVVARVRTQLSLVRASLLNDSYRDAIHMLGQAGDYNDRDTGTHIWRIGAFSRRLAQAAGWDEERAALIELAAPMHDIGKIGIPDAILKKPARLDPDEWTIMKTHSRIGFGILSKSRAPVFQLAAEIALRHHEHWDGGGYPDGLVGQAIPESARIVAVADVFDALTMKRPYKDAWPIERAVETINAMAGSHLDITVVAHFMDVLPEIIEIKKHWEEEQAPFSTRPTADLALDFSAEFSGRPRT